MLWLNLNSLSKYQKTYCETTAMGAQSVNGTRKKFQINCPLPPQSTNTSTISHDNLLSIDLSDPQMRCQFMQKIKVNSRGCPFQNGRHIYQDYGVAI